MDNQGKWLVDKYSIWGDSYDIYVDTEYGKLRIAEVFGGNTPNAQLIASAPLLLEACKEALNYLENWSPGERPIKVEANVYRKLESAIKKATNKGE